MENDLGNLCNLKESYLLHEVILRAPWWTLNDIWPKHHVYFVRHLRLCDLAKKELVRKQILRLGRYFVQKAWVDYHLPMHWHEKLRIRIFLAALLKRERVPLLKYELHSFQRNQLLAEVHLLYHPPLSRKKEDQQLFFDDSLREKMVSLAGNSFDKPSRED